MVWASALTKFGCPAGSRASGLVVKGLVACPPAAGAGSPVLKGLHKNGEAIAAGRPWLSIRFCKTGVDPPVALPRPAAGCLPL